MSVSKVGGKTAPMERRRQHGRISPRTSPRKITVTAKAKFSQPVLNAEQQADAELIYERIRGAFDEEARRFAAFMASKATRHIFGQTEYQIRDRSTLWERKYSKPPRRSPNALGYRTCPSLLTERAGDRIRLRA
ncbi:MAG: hypothetical protein ABI619_06080 [Betaproteobacteria bacterium]